MPKFLIHKNDLSQNLRDLNKFKEEAVPNALEAIKIKNLGIRKVNPSYTECLEAPSTIVYFVA